MTVPLLDLHAQYTPLRQALLDAVTSVCDSQRFIGGPEVEGLERDLSAGKAAYESANWTKPMLSMSETLFTRSGRVAA